MSSFTITLGTAAGHPQPQSFTRTIEADNVVTAIEATKTAAAKAIPAVPGSVWRIKNIEADLAAETPPPPTASKPAPARKPTPDASAA